MGFLDRLLGREEEPRRDGYAPAQSRSEDRSPRSEDEIALERYRYLLRTAPPEKLEEVHAEAFAKLTPEQRRQVYESLSTGGERPAGDDAESLARSATRAEVANPGTMERTFGARGQGGGPSFGSMVGSSLLGTVAGYVIGSALVSAFLPDPGYGDAGADGGDSADAGDSTDASADGGDAGADAGGDGGWGDGGFGGGDFGGGDFGGGDFGGGFDV